MSGGLTATTFACGLAACIAAAMLIGTVITSFGWSAMNVIYARSFDGRRPGLSRHVDVALAAHV